LSFGRGLFYRLKPLLVFLLLLLFVPSGATAKVPKFRWDHDVGWKVTSVAVSPDGKHIAAGSSNGNVYVFHENESFFWSYEVGSGVQDVAVSSGGRVLVGDGDSIYLINSTGGLIWERHIGDYVRSVAFSPEGSYIVAGSSDNRVYLFDDEGTRLLRYNTGSSVQGVAASSNGDRIAAGAGTNFFLLDNAGNLLWRYSIGAFIWDVVISPDGSTAVAGARGVHILDTENEEFVYRPPLGDEIRGVAMSEADKEILAGGESGYLYSYTVEGKRQWSYQFNDSVTGVAMTPSGELMVASSGNDIHFMEPPDTTPPKVEISVATDPDTGEIKIITNVDDSEAEIRVIVDGERIQNLTYLWDAKSAADGNHTIRIEATDAAGNTGYAKATVQVSDEGIGSEVKQEVEEETVPEEEPEETPPPAEETEESLGEEEEAPPAKEESYEDILLPLGKPEESAVEKYGDLAIGGIALIFAVWFLNALRILVKKGEKKYRWKR